MNLSDKNFLVKIFEVYFCFFFLIRLSIALKILLLLRFLTIIPLVIVSGKPPLLEIMTTAQPRLDASRLVLPKGSSHLEHTTAILLFLYISKTFLCFKNPKTLRFL